MAKVRFRDRIYDTDFKWMLVEIMHVETAFGLDYARDMSKSGTEMVMSLYIILRREDPRAWNPETFKTLSIDDFEILPPEPEATAPVEDGPDPTDGGDLPAVQSNDEPHVTDETVTC